MPVHVQDFKAPDIAIGIPFEMLAGDRNASAISPATASSFGLRRV
jgi:hypothetical protein